MTNEQQIEVIIDLIQDKKGKEISVIDLRDTETASFDYYIVCEGDVNVQVGAIADHIMKEQNDRFKIKPYGYDGFATMEWIIIDYNNILVHVFLRDKRHFYDLESLWGDAHIRQIPNLD